MLKLDTFGGALGIFVIATAVIFGGVYLLSCLTGDCP